MPQVHVGDTQSLQRQKQSARCTCHGSHSTVRLLLVHGFRSRVPRGVSTTRQQRQPSPVQADEAPHSVGDHVIPQLEG